MTASFDFGPLINTLIDYGKSAGYKALLGTPRPGTTDYQQAQSEKVLRQKLLDLANQQVQAQSQALQDPSGLQAWSKVFPQLNAQRAAESALRLGELDRSTDIALRGFTGKANAAAGAQNSMQEVLNRGELDRLGLENKGKLDLLKEGLTGQQQALAMVTGAQQGMYERGLADRSAYANRLADLSEKSMLFNQNMYRRAMQQRIEANSGVRGFLSNILAPLAVAGAGAYSLLRS